MERDDAARKTIRVFVNANGGHARRALILRHVRGERPDLNDDGITHFLCAMTDAGELVRAGYGDYWDPQALASRSEKLLCRLPFGTTLKGRLIAAMLMRKLSRAKPLFAYLRAQGYTRNIRSVHTALWFLHRNGWLDKKARDAYVLSKKTRTMLGVSEMAIPASPDIPFQTYVSPLILTYLKEHGSSSPLAITRRYGDPKVSAHVRGTYDAMRKHRDAGRVVRTLKGIYKLPV